MSNQTNRQDIVLVDATPGDFVDPRPHQTVVVLAPNRTLIRATVPAGLNSSVVRAPDRAASDPKPRTSDAQAVLNLFHEILDAHGHRGAIHKVEDLLSLKADVLATYGVTLERFEDVPVLDLHKNAVMPYLAPR